MAYRKERSSSSSSFFREKLHSFTFPDNKLKWGAQRSPYAPVTDRSEEVENEQTYFAQNQQFAGSPVMNSDHREDSVVDLNSACEGIMRMSMGEERGKGKGKVSEDDCNDKNRAGGLSSWRSACKAPQGPNDGDDMMVRETGLPIGGSGGGRSGNEKGGNCEGLLPARRTDSRLRSARRMGIGVEQKMEMPKFSFSLTKKEIEDDFLVMTGAKPPRKPKTRPKALQKKCNDLVPGLWLGEVTLETYKVDEKPKGKGLK